MFDETKDNYGNVIKIGSTVAIMGSSNEFVVTAILGCDDISISGLDSDLYYSRIQGNRVRVK